jgi:hypothetical protein
VLSVKGATAMPVPKSGDNYLLDKSIVGAVPSVFPYQEVKNGRILSCREKLQIDRVAKIDSSNFFGSQTKL